VWNVDGHTIHPQAFCHQEEKWSWPELMGLSTGQAISLADATPLKDTYVDMEVQ